MAWWAYLDANAIAKRYAPETGTAVVNHLFRRVAKTQMVCLTLCVVEVVSVFVRKRNSNRITAQVYQQTLADLSAEIFQSPDVTKLEASDRLVLAALPLVEAHAINSNDALVLRSALDVASSLRARGDNLMLVTSDQRLLRAGSAEGLTTFNPETQSEADLDALLGP